MPHGKKQIRHKIAGKCIFCGLGNLSKEHIWPQWAAAMLRTNSGPYGRELIVNTAGHKTIRHDKKERPGHITTVKVRAVCAKCNNEWMSAIEVAAKPVAIPMMLGKPLTLDRTMQTALVNWLVLKLMVMEQTNRSDATFSSHDREQFLVNRTVPAYVRIWITQCFSNVWCNAYLRHAATLGSTLSDRPKDDKKNSFATAFGIGELFVFAIGTTATDVDLAGFFELGDELKQLWPLVQDLLKWPPDCAINDAGATRVTGLFGALMRHPRTLRIP
jgi:hypothetical protein